MSNLLAALPFVRYFGPLFSGGRWVYNWWRGKRLSPDEILALRQKWKDEIEAQLAQRRHQGLRSDVIVRDMKRMDSYPDTDDEGKGISSWFRAGLVGTYHKGVKLGLQRGTLTRCETGWRFTDYQGGEKGDITVLLVGFVPYERIEAIDWNGDEYYGFPHIYCYFNSGLQEPYERTAFCEEKKLDEFPIQVEVAEYETARERSRKAGVDHFM